MIDMQLQETTLICGECGQAFTFTAGEQQSYSRRGQSKPNQCAFCRAAHMIAGSVRSLSGSSSERSERSTHAMFVAVCDQCGKQTKVPFEPRGYRPVYCSDCYRLRRESSGGYDGARSRTGSYYRK